jgi:hypothetical protein
MRREVLCLLVACALPAWGGEAPLTLQGQTAYHGVTLPLSVLAQARYPDLSDIRVLNARGEPVPHAWVDEAPPSTAEEQENDVPFFQAPATASAVTASQQGGWIIDLRKVQGALLELRLSVPAGTHGIYGFAIESSDDLQQWRARTPAAQLLSLQQQGLRLEHTSFDLAGLRARYLRLRPQIGSPVPPLSAVTVTSISHYNAAPPVQWSEPLAPTQCTAQYCDYTLPRHLPLDRLEWQLADANTLATVDLLVQRAGGEVAPSRDHSRRHRLRDHLRGVRRKDAPTTPVSPLDWTHLQRTTAYRLRLPEGEVRSQTLRLDAGAVTQLRVQPQGGMVQLGAKPPTLRIGAPAATLVFLAREPAPFRLAWGGEVATAMSLAQLMPTRKPNDPLPVGSATVVMPAVVTPTAAPAPVAANAGPTAPDAPRKLSLWAVLLLALSVMGSMAWVLLRPPKKS